MVFLRAVFSEWADFAPVAGVEKGLRSLLFHLSVFLYLPFFGLWVWGFFCFFVKADCLSREQAKNVRGDSAAGEDKARAVRKC